MTDTIVWTPPVRHSPTPVAVEIDDVERRNRLTVLVRLLAALPHIVVWFALALGAVPVVVVGWFAALFRQALPGWARRYLRGYVRYGARLSAYLLLLTDKYPPFGDAEYPVKIDFGPDYPLERGAVLFRIFIALPAAFLCTVLQWGATLVVAVAWLIALVAGRVPKSIYSSLAAVFRFNLRYTSYWLLLTPAYPGELFGDSESAVGPRDTRSFSWRLGRGARVALVVLIAVGTGGYAASAVRGETQPLGPFQFHITREESAQGRLQDADGKLRLAVTRFDTSMTTCVDAACASALRDLGVAVDRFAERVNAIDVPASAIADEGSLRSDSSKVADWLRTAAENPSGASQTEFVWLAQQMAVAEQQLFADLASA